MVITEYRSPSAIGTAKVKEYDWNAFCNKISHPAVKIGMTWEIFKKLPKDYQRDKNGKVLDYDEETQNSVKQKGGGAVFGKFEGEKAGRASINFPTRSAIVFDYEGCTSEIYERIAENLKNVTYCYHSTCKHRPPEDVRLHVIIPFAKAVDWKLYSVMAVLLAEKLGLKGLDVTSLRRAQMELFCVQLRDSEYVYKIHNTERLLDVEAFLSYSFGTLDFLELTKKLQIDWSKYALRELVDFVRKNTVHEYTVKGKTVKVKRNYSFQAVPPRPGDVKSCFNAVFSVRDILDSLPEFYQPAGDRYTYYRGSGIGGVWVNEDNTRAGSYHADSGDPLFGRSLTAFDIFLIYRTKESDKYPEKLRKAHEFATRSEKYKKFYYKIKKW